MKLLSQRTFSTRYSDSFIRRTVEKALPGLLDGRLHLWL